jgi:hypothetical protein
MALGGPTALVDTGLDRQTKPTTAAGLAIVLAAPEATKGRLAESVVLHGELGCVADNPTQCPVAMSRSSRPSTMPPGCFNLLYGQTDPIGGVERLMGITAATKMVGVLVCAAAT